MNCYAVDFETYYEAGYGIEDVGMWHYIHDKRFDPYLVSIYGPDVDYVGHPKDAPWDKISNHDWVSHNNAFDQQVYTKFMETWDGNDHQTIGPREWFCTANLSVYLGGPRSLKEASKYLLGREMDKGMRNYMKGKTWAQAVADGKAEALMAYARTDSVNCYDIWMQYNDRWPQEERDLAELMFVQTQRGIAVDKQKLERELPAVYDTREQVRAQIPWRDAKDDKGEPLPLLSTLAMKAWLKEQGIDVPSTCEARDPIFKAWQEKHTDVTCIKAMQTYRSANALFTKGKVLYDRVRDDGRFGFEQRYFGATTGRASGGYEDERSDSSKFNVFNMPKEAMYGFDLRGCLVPGKGKKFIIGDYTQVEPRSQAWLVKDEPFMKLLRQGQKLYDAYARSTLGWEGKDLKSENSALYALAKAHKIALGYQMGWAKLINAAKTYGYTEFLDLPIENYQAKLKKFMAYINRYDQTKHTEEYTTEKEWMWAVNSWCAVTGFRADNPRITDAWKQLESDCRKCVGTDYVVELPSGRLLRYFNVKIVAGKLMVQKTMDQPHINVWGGFLMENITQATARDILCQAMLKLEAAGITTLFTVYDEIVCEVDKDFDPAKIRALMIEAPQWMPGMPLDVSIEEATFYKK